jgi:hypothetical protein
VLGCIDDKFVDDPENCFPGRLSKDRVPLDPVTADEGDAMAPHQGSGQTADSGSKVRILGKGRVVPVQGAPDLPQGGFQETQNPGQGTAIFRRVLQEILEPGNAKAEGLTGGVMESFAQPSPLLFPGGEKFFLEDPQAGLLDL